MVHCVKSAKEKNIIWYYKLKIPTYALPWANVLHAANYSSHYESIRINDWVFITTLDGQNAQEIIVLGVFPGIIPDKVIKSKG